MRGGKADEEQRLDAELAYDDVIRLRFFKDGVFWIDVKLDNVGP